MAQTVNRKEEETRGSPRDGKGPTKVKIVSAPSPSLSVLDLSFLPCPLLRQEIPPLRSKISSGTLLFVLTFFFEEGDSVRSRPPPLPSSSPSLLPTYSPRQDPLTSFQDLVSSYVLFVPPLLRPKALCINTQFST